MKRVYRCSFIVAQWVGEEGKASENRSSKREVEEADEVEVTPGVTIGRSRRVRAALIGCVDRKPEHPESLVL